jgi:nitrite reductase/ring-hydroxylating ferredoxin subunit
MARSAAETGMKTSSAVPCQQLEKMSKARRLANLAELQQRKTITFAYKEEGISREGFLAWFNGQVVAYQNTCRHIPIRLDYGDGRFFNPDGTHFVCQTHGATYEPLTGQCIAGPCTGAALKKIPIEILNDEIWFEEPG